MMSEKFVKINHFEINDTSNDYRPMECASSLDADVICTLLNEQFDTIEKLKSENEQLRKELHIVETDCKNVKESRNHYREENEQLRKERDGWKVISCQDLSKWSIFSNEVSILQETRDVDRFLEKYYAYCNDMIKEEDE